MKKKNLMTRNLTSLLLLAVGVVFFTACEDEFSDVGTHLVNSDNFNSLKFDLSKIESSTAKIERYQSNNTGDYLLGVYQDPVYGGFTANIVSQLALQNPNPTFGEDIELDSVVLNIPYYSTAVSIEDEVTTFELDSVYGDEPISLGIYRNNYFLRDFDPEDNFDAQAYYSNQFDLFEQNYDPNPLTVENIDNFKPSADQILLYEFPDDATRGDTLRLRPGLRVHLKTDYFKELIFDNEGSSELLSSSNFQNFFRGLYFKSENITNNGNLSLLNFSADDANITLYYKTSTPLGSSEQDVNGDGLYEREYQLNFGENIVNVIDNENNINFDDDRIYLRGNEGSIGVVDIFSDQVQLDSIRNLNWLVNEANLTFYVDESLVNEDMQPRRLFIYDVKNNRVLDDYIFDISASNNPRNSRTVHLGPLTDDDNGNHFYKIRITELVDNIINKDSTNTKLGVVVSSNVNRSSYLNATYDSTDEDLDFLPITHALYPKGTILYGANAEDDSKKLKLNIYYSETQQTNQN